MKIQLKLDIAVLYVMIILFFAVIHYQYIDEYHDMYTITDAVYFSAVTTTTTGYGDIYPKTKITRQITTVQIMLTAILTIMLVITPATYYETNF